MSCHRTSINGRSNMTTVGKTVDERTVTNGHGAELDAALEVQAIGTLACNGAVGARIGWVHIVKRIVNRRSASA